MTARLTIVAAALAILAVTALPVSAQKGKPKPPADILGTAWIDNDADTLCVSDPGTRIHSDCQGDNGAYTQIDGDGTYPKLLGDTGAFWLRTYGSRYVTIDFSDLVPGSVLCGTSCYRTFGDVLDTTTPRAGGLDWTVSIHGNAIDAAGKALSSGLRSLDIGQSSDARFFVNIPDPEGRSFHYSLFFDTTNYPNSDFATVTRTAACSWLIESNGYAELVAHGTGKNKNTREGRFWMPFRVVFEAPAC
jgi:hypothetical protein